MGELSYLPVEARSKKPRDKDWGKRNYVPGDFDGYNIGLKIEPGMVDVDLDWPEAQMVTRAVHDIKTKSWGRKGSLTHLVYRCDLPASINFELPHDPGREVDGAHGRMVLQLRTSVEGEACYAMIPPSVHPDGDTVEWIKDMDLTEHDAASLVERFSQIAGLAALARFYPSEGNRDEALMSLAGCAARAGWDEERIENFIRIVCTVAGDTSEMKMRMDKAGAAIKRLKAGRKVRGIPATAKQLNIPRAWMQKIAVWLGWAQEAPDSNDRAVFVSGVVREVAHQAWDVLRDYEVDGNPGVYQYGQALARVDEGRLQILDRSTLKNDLNRCATWIKYDSKGKPFKSSAPDALVEDMMSARAAERTVPELRRVDIVPCFTRDGRLLNRHGFDEESGIFLDLKVAVDVPEEPTRRQVREALKTLWRPLSNFPFQDRSDRVHALAMVLTPYMRDMFGPVPFFFVSKPAAGTGASLLIESALYPTLGEFPAAVAPPKSDDEMSKTLTSLLLDGRRVGYFDNANNIYSPSFAMTLTATTYQARVLGASKLVTVPMQMIFVGSGNNTNVSGELYRRIIDIRIDAQMASPEDRHVSQFRIPDLKSYVREHDADLARAACTIIQHWVAQGMPVGDGHKASYEEWARKMSGLFASIGVRGFLETPEDRKPVDPEVETVKGIVLAMFDLQRGKYAQKEWERAIQRTDKVKVSDLEVLIDNDVMDYDPGPGSVSRQLPLMLRRYKDRVFEFETEKGDVVTLTLKTGQISNVTRWWVEADRADAKIAGKRKADEAQEYAEDVPF